MYVSAKNVVKAYNDKKVLDIGELNFENKCIYVIKGSNGSGKSTLLESIAGIITPDSGKILYDTGFSAKDLTSNISMMIQKPYLFNTTVYNNIIIGMKFRKLQKNEIKERIKKYCGYFHMEDILYKNAKKLSGGEAQKVALLRTAVLETRLILLDEPTASMDFENTLKAEKLIRDMKNEETTIIMITHDNEQAKRIGDKIIFMDKGRIQ